MSTRMSKLASDAVSVATGYEGYNLPDDFSIPSCTIEDVDRAVFNLFNIDLPLVFEREKQSSRIPVIFATGERFAVLRRRRPLRDKHGALVLPLVSIMRTGISQDVAFGMGPGQTGPITIRQKLSKEDPRYQSLVNKLNLQNQDNLAHETNFLSGSKGSLPGTVASRRTPAGLTTDTRNGKLLQPNLGDNIFDVITLPPVKFFDAKYEITFWAQYTQQMNNLIMAVMSSYQNNHRRTFRIETPKGYWFVAYTDADLSPGNNYDDFTDEERIVRYTFTMTVPAYVIASDHPGGMNPLRKFTSAPQISFESTPVAAPFMQMLPSGPPSGNPQSYILQDMNDLNAPFPGDAIGSSANMSGLNAAGYPSFGGAVASSDSRAINNKVSTGYATTKPDMMLMRVVKDPFTGKSVKKVVRVKSRNQRKGETVYREGITKPLDKLC